MALACDKVFFNLLINPLVVLFESVLDHSDHVKSSNILDGTTFPLLLIDRTAGLQETLDFTFLAADPGLYERHFVAHVTSEGREYELRTAPFYIAENKT